MRSVGRVGLLCRRLADGGPGNGAQLRLALGQLHEKLLTGEWAGEGLGVLEELAGAQVAAVGLLQAGLYIVSKVSGENLVVDAGKARRIANREGYLAALEEVARHPVGRAEIDFVVAAVGEVEDARVLQKAAYDGADANPLREAR